MIVRVVLAFVLIGAFGIQTAEACFCGGSWWNSPVEQVPLHGTVFAYGDFYGRESSPTLAWRGGLGTTTVTKVSTTIARVDYEGTAGSVLLVSARDRAADSAFVLTPAPARVLPALVSITRAREMSTCGIQDALQVVIDAPAAAMRARWRSLEGDVSDYWIVGNRFDQYELGKRYCAGTTLPPSTMDAGGTLTLVAVLPDGSEAVIADRVWFRPEVTWFGGEHEPSGREDVLDVTLSPSEDVPFAALGSSLVLVLLAVRSLLVPQVGTSLPAARVRRRS